MSETGEIPPEYVEEKSPVVEAARSAVRTALETSKAVKDYRETLKVRKGLFRVYETWEEARRKVVGAMTEADRQSFNTKMMEMGMKFRGIVGSAVDITLNVASKVMFATGTGLAIASIHPAIPTFWLGAGVAGGGWAAGRLGEWRGRAGMKKAERHADKKIAEYKREEDKLMKGKGTEVLKERIDRKVKDIITGFAYPEGKPVNPPPMKA